MNPDNTGSTPTGAGSNPNDAGTNPTGGPDVGPEGPLPEPGENTDTPSLPSVATLTGSAATDGSYGSNTPIPFSNSASAKSFKSVALIGGLTIAFLI